MVINGVTEFVGSDRSKLTNTIERSKKMNKIITLNASADNNKVIVDFTINNKSQDDNILIALVQKQATTDVRRGENGGRKLHHINIVREFEVSKKNKASLELTLPENTKADYFIVALLQNERTGSIDGYNQINIK